MSNQVPRTQFTALPGQSILSAAPARCAVCGYVYSWHLTPDEYCPTGVGTVNLSNLIGETGQLLSAIADVRRMSKALSTAKEALDSAEKLYEQRAHEALAASEEYEAAKKRLDQLIEVPYVKG